MAQIEIGTTLPRIDRSRDGALEVRWNRNRELDYSAQYMESFSGRAKILVVNNLQKDLAYSFARMVAERAQVPLVRLRSAWSVRLIPICIVAYYVSRFKTVPGSLVMEILKYTTAASVHRTSDGYILRSISNYIHSQRRAGAPVMVSAALARFGVKLEDPSLDVLADQAWADEKMSEFAYVSRFRADVETSPSLQRFLSESAFYMDLSVPGGAARLFNTLGADFPTRMIVGNTIKLLQSPPSFREEGEFAIMNMGVIDFSTAQSILQPFALAVPPDQFDELLLASSVRYPGLQDGGYFSERELGVAVRAIESYVSGALSQQDMSPKSAIIQAGVEGDVLRLEGRERADSGTAAEVLEALCEEHKENVGRLRTQLAGSNVGLGFTSRLASVERRLGLPLTLANTAVLATQVRGLEDMYPAVGDMLTDISAADVGATISGLGLFVRQFVAWRSLLSEAEQSDDIAQDVISELNIAVVEVQSKSNFVEPELAQYMDEIKDLANTSSDDVIRFGYLRSVGNVLRAVGRYLRDRLTGSSDAFNKTVENAVGLGGAVIVFGGAFLVLKPTLLRLAATVPDEFGWIIPLLVMLGDKLGGV